MCCTTYVFHYEFVPFCACLLVAHMIPRLYLQYLHTLDSFFFPVSRVICHHCVPTASIVYTIKSSLLGCMSALAFASLLLMVCHGLISGVCHG